MEAVVDISAKDSKRVMKRIGMLEGVESVEEREDDSGEETQEVHPGYDLLVKCKHGANKFDVEELLLGVNGVEVTVV